MLCKILKTMTDAESQMHEVVGRLMGASVIS